MPPATRRSLPNDPARPKSDARSVVAWLEAHGNKRYRDGMVRYAAPHRARSGPVGAMRKCARAWGRIDLALALWDSWCDAWLHSCTAGAGARADGSLVPGLRQLGICGTVLLHLFDPRRRFREGVQKWAGRREEFVRRGTFALLASLAAHDKSATDSAFAQCLPLIGRAADDERNFVKKGELWALRLIGERSPALHAKSVALARRLAESPSAAARWVGKSALRELASPAARRRLASKRRAAAD
jgi:hypothetical protein